MPYKPFGTRDQLEILSLGTELALTEIIGATVGYWLDVKLGTLPWCLVGGVLLGFVLSLVRVISVAKRTEKNGRS